MMSGILRRCIASRATTFPIPKDIEIKTTKIEDVDKYINLMLEHFTPREPLALGMMVSSDSTMRKELIGRRVRICAACEASYCAIHVPDNEIVGAFFNNILTRESLSILTEHFDIGENNQEIQRFQKVLAHLEKSFNAFEDPTVNKVLEMSAMTVHPKYSGVKIAHILTEMSLSKGRNLGCEIATGICTNIKIQNIFQKAGFTLRYSIDAATLEKDGTPLKKELMGDTSQFQLYTKDLRTG